jgi:2-polyprenyl-3-methyl-5-hydroxy-6-metoxy-1,4-benzoquinol methylase
MMDEMRNRDADNLRFGFGKNWSQFLKTIDEERITFAERSLLEMLEMKNLDGKSFLDIGSGSGLSSLAARRLGARVYSFDYDPHSVACTAELRRRYFADDPGWTVDQGSVLDRDYLEKLGEFDIVYSWGVLHHTGAMWQSLANATIPLTRNGILYIAIYNDQGVKSRFWHKVKRLYCANRFGQIFIAGLFLPLLFFGSLSVDLLQMKNPATRYGEYKNCRGMSIWHDWLDWLGGYPFEVAKPNEVVNYYESKGYRLRKIYTCDRKMGNNEFVFVKF